MRALRHLGNRFKHRKIIMDKRTRDFLSNCLAKAVRMIELRVKVSIRTN